MKRTKSEICDGMQIDWDASIEMDDGTVLRADVFRPVGDGEYPVILSYGPYAKGLAFQEGYKGNWARRIKAAPEVLAGSSNKYQNWELVDPEKWVPDGYACVRVDSRGAGRSPGYLDVWSPREVSVRSLDAVDHDELPMIVEIAGVARMQPAILHVGGGSLGVLVVAEEHVGVAHHDLADTVDIRIVDADFDILGHCDAGGIGIDFAGWMECIGPEQFGLAVERAQRHAHHLEEFAGIASGVYKITRLLPPEGDNFQYKIKSTAEPHERMAKESQLDSADIPEL
jgi:hypothetical protein